MERLTDHLIIVSFDCLSSLDFSLLSELPNFRKLIRDGATAKKVTTIYPSVTYPCHTSIVTGRLPIHHGIVSNSLIQPGRESPDWNWYRRNIKGTTLYDEAKKAGLTTAALLWPVTAKADIDYNMPEIFANRPWQHQIAVSLMNGSPLFQLEMNQKFGSIRKGIQQPELDDFVLESSVDTIMTKKPNLMLIHFTDLDSMRHEYGFSSSEAFEAIKRHDIRLGRIFDALKSAGIYDNSTIIALGDHSALDEGIALLPNVVLRKEGLIILGGKNRVLDWKAYCKSCDGSAYIYLKDPSVYEQVKMILEELMLKPASGIESILTSEQAAALGADPNCAFMLEAKEGYYFLEDMFGEYKVPIMSDYVKRDRKYTLAAHGYSPTKENYETVLMLCGKGIKQGANISSMQLVDEGPTFARLLGLDLGITDGKVIEELLQTHDSSATTLKEEIR